MTKNGSPPTLSEKMRRLRIVVDGLVPWLAADDIKIVQALQPVPQRLLEGFFIKSVGAIEDDDEGTDYRALVIKAVAVFTQCAVDLDIICRAVDLAGRQYRQGVACERRLCADTRKICTADEVVKKNWKCRSSVLALHKPQQAGCPAKRAARAEVPKPRMRSRGNKPEHDALIGTRKRHRRQNDERALVRNRKLARRLVLQARQSLHGTVQASRQCSSAAAQSEVEPLKEPTNASLRVSLASRRPVDTEHEGVSHEGYRRQMLLGMAFRIPGVGDYA